VVIVQVANPARNGAGIGTLSIASLRAEIKKIRDISKHWREFRPGQAAHWQEHRSYDYIRALLPKTSELDEPTRRLINEMREGYILAMDSGTSSLENRIVVLKGLVANTRRLGKAELEGELADKTRRLLFETEALFSKKIGTAYLKLSVSENGTKYDLEGVRLALDNLKNAVRCWEENKSGCLDYPKALLWIATICHAMDKMEECIAYGEECQKKCMDGDGIAESRKWLYDKAGLLIRDARWESSRLRFSY